jgi:hypothetical protein
MLKKKHIPHLYLGSFLAGMILLANSCGSQRTFQAKPSAFGLTKFVIVEIPDFKSSLDSVSSDAIWKIPNEVADKLRKEEVFIGVTRAPVSITDRVLIVDGTLVEFTPTIWYKKIIHTGKVVAHVRFVDKADHKVVADATFEGTAEGGIFGGGMNFAYSRLADEIVDYMKTNHSP